MNTPSSESRVLVHPAFTVAVAILHAAALVLAIVLIICEMVPEKYGKVDFVFDGTQVMKYEDFYDLEKTHIPTDEEVQALANRIIQTWEQLEKAGWPDSNIDAAELAYKKGIKLVTIEDVVNAIGHPHYSTGSGIEHFTWETDTGKIFTLWPSVPEYLKEHLKLNNHEQYLWACEHYGYVVWSPDPWFFSSYSSDS